MHTTLCITFLACALTPSAAVCVNRYLHRDTNLLHSWLVHAKDAGDI